MTEKLYDIDSFLFEFSATVLSCTPNEKGYDVILDRTCFFPEGGGQGGDQGVLDGIFVFDTQIKDGMILHRTVNSLPVGASVLGRVEETERFRKMQNHSGEHILSGIIYSRFGYENVGFHLGPREMTVDYDGILSPTDLVEVEKAVNRVVWENRKIVCRYPKTEELKTLRYRSKKELNESVRIVTVEGIDVCACCAPHVQYTGQIGSVVITEAIHWKGGMRLTVRCGSDALEEYTALRSDEKEISSLLSVPRTQCFPAVQKLQQEFASLRRTYGALQKEYALICVDRLPDTEGNQCLFLEETDGAAMRAAALAGAEKCSGVFVCLSGSDAEGYRYVMAATRPGLSSCAEEIHRTLNGRGGGSETMMQGSFSAGQKKICDYFCEFCF